jgi:Ca2+-binding RTX toxin-like protein
VGREKDKSMSGVSRNLTSGNDNWPTGFGDSNALNDSINGLAGNDTIDGGLGNDTIDGGLGNDSLVGGDGNDGIFVGNIFGGGGGGSDTALGGSGDDFFLNSGSNNFVSGGIGNDTIFDFVGGNNTLIGGDGTDLVRFDTGVTTGVTVNLAIGSAFRDINGGESETLIGIENVTGDNGNDSILGDSLANVLDGGNGNDTLDGGDDEGGGTLIGGAGNDRLIGGASDFDYASYASATGAVTVNLGAGTSSGADGNDTLTGIEGAFGSNHADSLQGLANGIDVYYLYGEAGNDTLVAGSAFNQFFSGGADADSLQGGNGFSQILYGDGGNDTLVAGGEYYQFLYGDDGGAGYGDDGGAGDVIGNDSLQGGNGGYQQLGGDGGNDTLVAGRGESQVLYGDYGIGNEFSGAGDDSLQGGNGSNQSLYGEAGNDTLVAGGGNDQALLGGDDDDSLLGGTNNDELFGGNGVDRIDGGQGNDTLDGGAGEDLLDGGTGNDFASYQDATGGVDAALTGNVAGAAGLDVLTSIEGLIGSNFADTLIGNVSANTLIGGDGADLLQSGGGTLGGDLLDYGDGNDEFNWGVSGLTSGAMTLLGGNGEDTLNLGSNWRSGPVTDNSWINFQQIGGSATVYSQGWNNVVCFAEGTRIVTPSGEDAVENLRAGDMVLAMRDGQAGFEALRWVGFMDVALPRNAAMAAKTAPILIKAGAIAPGMPARDLRVSPDHAMEVDGHLIPAKHLVNGQSIIQETWCRRVRYFHLELEAHGLLLSEGTWSESYLDDGNRDAFNNTAMTGLFLDFEAGRSKGQYDDQACLPVLRQGLKLDEIHGRIALRAAELAQPAKGRRWG